jgi:hypothetical protein
MTKHIPSTQIAQDEQSTAPANSADLKDEVST